MAEMLMAQAAQPLQAPQTRGNLDAPISPMAVLGQLAQAYAGGFGSRKVAEAAEARETGLAQEYAQGIEAYLRQAQGGQVVDLEGQKGPDGSYPMTEVPGDRRAAVLQALASRNPLLREFGQKEWERLGEMKEVGGVLYDPMTMETQQLRGQAPQLESINGDLYERNPTTGALKKLDNAPKMSVSVGGPQVIMGKGQTKLAESMASEAVKDVQEANKQAGEAAKTLDAINRLQEVQNTYSGPLAPASVWLGQLADSVGLSTDKERLANSETFNSEATQIWLGVMNSVGGARGLTETESNRIAKALPSLVQTQEGRQQILQMMTTAAEQARRTAEIKSNALIRAGQAEDPTVYFQSLKEAGLPAYTPAPPALQREPQTATSGPVRRYNPQTGRIE